MAEDQDNVGEGSGGEQKPRQRREPPRLAIVGHEPGRAEIAGQGMYKLPLRVFVQKLNRDEAEEIYCQARVNGANETDEQLLGEDGMTEFALDVQGLKPYIEVKLRWQFDQNPEWRKLGFITIPDPDKDPEDEMLCQRIVLALFRWLGWMSKKEDTKEESDV